MITFYTLCNAHLDPVWLWRRSEGMAEAISTFRVAADFCERYDGFVFNHNESVLYEWVEEYEPRLFERIRELVRQKKWRIMGGWYLQPDCNMPSGESFIRQIEAGNSYFKEKFGVKPETAINFDPFGHTRGLVQILKKHGYKNYLFMRPGDAAPEEDFIWRGFDGSEVQCHRLMFGYSSGKGRIVEKIENLLDEPQQTKLMLWGIGDHGGGPSREDWEAMGDYIRLHPEIKFIHAGCEEYFNAVPKIGLPVVEKSLTHCMVGCYTSMVRVKQKHRELENTLAICEKMGVSAPDGQDKALLDESQKALLFSEFHDSLPGTMIKKAEDEIIRLQDHGLEVLSKSIDRAFFRLCAGQPCAENGTIPVEVFNPNPYRITQDVEIEFQLESQNRNENEVTIARVRDSAGRYLPTQNIKEESMLNMDWRKKIAFTAQLEPMSISRFDCELRVEPFRSRPIESAEENETHIIFDNGSVHIEINKSTGLIDSYAVDGVEKLKKDSFKICVFRDNEDPWAMQTDGFYDKIGEFALLSDRAANEFNGFPDDGTPNVRVTENGAVKMSVQAVFGYGKSFAVLTYDLPKNHRHIDVRVTLYSNDASRMYKLSIPTVLGDCRFMGQTAFGTQELEKDSKEVSYQKWCGLFSESGGTAVINNGTYGGSCDGGTMYISLLRTPVYSAHPIDDRPIAEHGINHDRIDMGVREFRYRLTPDTEFIDAQAEVFNQPVLALPFFPSGSGEKTDTRCELDNRNMILTRYCRCENGGVTARVYNSSDKRQSGRLTTPFGAVDIDLGAFEYKTFTI